MSRQDTGSSSKAWARSLIPERLYSIIGGALSHSLSPLVHNWGFAREALPYCYHAFEIQAGQIAAFMLTCRTLPISGVSVTIPHKQAVIPYLDGLTGEAADTGAVNTLFWEGDELWGDNTDCRGFVAPLQRQGLKPQSVLILGAGGAALACIEGLRRLSAPDITVTARSQAKSAELAKRTGVRSLPWEERTAQKADLLVNATPLGTSGSLEKTSPIPRSSLDNFQTVYDLVYNPLKTRLLSQAEEAGRTGISGLAMFVHQALLQFERWTGCTLPERELYELLIRTLQVETA